MKTNQILYCFISSKALFKTLLLISIFSLPHLSFGQLLTESNKHSFNSQKVTEFNLTSFVCKSIEGKVYVMWAVIERSDICFYILERSENDKNYHILNIKNGAKSPNNLELLNSFIDEKPLAGASFYRVRRVSNESNITSNSQVVNDLKIIGDVDPTNYIHEEFAGNNSTALSKSTFE